MIDLPQPEQPTIDEATAIELLAELRVTEQPDEFHALDAYFLNLDVWASGQLVLKRAKELARERGAPWREWRGQFRNDLAHSLPAVGYLN